MQVTSVKNDYGSNLYQKNSQINFASKIGFKYRSIGGGYHPKSINDLYEALNNGSKTLDTTFLKAYKGLMNDGKKNQYTFVNDYLSKEYYLKADDSLGTRFYHLPRHLENNLLIRGIRDMIVDIARQQGIIEGKPIGLDSLSNLYHSRGIYGNVSKMDNLLEKNGFVVHNPKTKCDIEAENELVKDELEEIEKLKLSNSKYKDGYINYTKSVLQDKIDYKYRSEYNKLLMTQEKIVESDVPSISG